MLSSVGSEAGIGLILLTLIGRIHFRDYLKNCYSILYRYFEREVSSGAALLKDVLNDLEDVILICKGGKRQTNYHRLLLSDLVKGILPARWCRYVDHYL